VGIGEKQLSIYCLFGGVLAGRERLMPLLFPLLLLLGLFLPGYFVAKSLRNPLSGASAFVISLLILFHSVFWLGIAGAPITLWTVVPCLAGAAAAGAWLAKRK
jgi:hypothetical protein